MRYPCIGFPFCLKTFENGYVLRGHQLSCEYAQREIINQKNREEHVHAIQYDCNITGIKSNKIYPTFTGLDHTQKLHLRNQFQLGALKTQEYRPLRRPPDPSIVTPQTTSTVMDLSGYYT